MPFMFWYHLIVSDLISQYLWYSGQRICLIQSPMPILREQFSQWWICNANITLLLFAFKKNSFTYYTQTQK